MIANYHTHTPRCTHAAGTEEEYVLAGIEAGLKILGFADHAPYPYSGGYYCHIRMRPEELEDYAASVLTLREKYKEQIQIPLGVEIEYFPQFWNEQLSVLWDAGVEYLLLGQHWADFCEGGHYSGKPTDREDLLAAYCARVRDAMQTGVITYLAHPDLFRFTGDDRAYENHMRNLCREANACGVPLEINLLGIRSGRHYPNRRFWELAAEEGCTAVLGSDAHVPEGVCDRRAEEMARDLVRELGLKLSETVSLQSF